MRKMNKKGISLPEMLAIVVIMGVIAAITIPLIGKTIDNAKRKAFLGDVIAIKEAVQTYCVANEDDDKNYVCEEDSVLLINSNAGKSNKYGLESVHVKNLGITIADAEEDISELEESLSNDFEHIIGGVDTGRGIWLKWTDESHNNMEIAVIGSDYKTGSKKFKDSMKPSQLYINPIDNSKGTKDKIQPIA